MKIRTPADEFMKPLNKVMIADLLLGNKLPNGYMDSRRTHPPDDIQNTDIQSEKNDDAGDDINTSTNPDVSTKVPIDLVANVPICFTITPAGRVDNF